MAGTVYANPLPPERIATVSVRHATAAQRADQRLSSPATRRSLDVCGTMP
jgi:hypothetical protein